MNFIRRSQSRFVVKAKIMNRLLFAFFLTLCQFNLAFAQQECVTYKLVPRTTYKTRPVNLSATSNVTVMDTKQVVSYKPVWTRETRQRKTTSYKPVVTTSERIERYLVRRPIIETSLEERTVEETSYETVTEMTEKRYLVESPVVETQMREEKIVVRKPVTTTVMQSEDYLTYKPTTVTETQLVAGATIHNDLQLQSGRNRLRFLRPGYYVDPASGLTAYRNRGLHWVRDQNLVLQPTIEPTLTPQQVSRTTYSPEKVTVQKPVQVTRYVDEIENRMVPVKVSTTSKKIHVLKIPVTVKKPVTRIRTEKVPVEEVRYREEVYTRKVPVTSTKYQRVEQVEPYEVEVCKWVPKTSEVQVPRTVARRANYSVDQIYPVTQWIRVPVDAFGNALSSGEVVATEVHPAVEYKIADRIAAAPIRRSYKPIETTEVISSKPPTKRTIVGEPIIVRKLGDDEMLDLSESVPSESQLKLKSILVPPTETSRAVTKTTAVKKPPTADQKPELEITPLEPMTRTIEIEPAPAPSSPGAIPTLLDVEASDEAKIDVRPGSGNSNELDLNNLDD